MWYVIALFAILIVGLFDGHVSSVFALFLIYSIGYLSVSSIKNKTIRVSGTKVFLLVFSVYVISACIASQSFVNGQFFYVTDPMRYIENYQHIYSWSLRSSFSRLLQTYLFLADDNGLYNIALSFWSFLANHYFDGASVLYLTLLETLFGVLAILEIYKIFSMYFVPSSAVKYTCFFAIVSLFHIYSLVIIRDIVITYFYLLGLRKILGEPKSSDGFILFFVFIITMGIRLFSGLFFGTFIMVWLYNLIEKKYTIQNRIIVVSIILVGLAFVGASIASSVLIDTTFNRIGDFDELYENKGGLVSRLRELPIGVRHIAILLFSNLPLSSFQRFMLSTSFSNYYMSLLVLLFQLSGFVIFYGCLYFCFVKKHIKRMKFNDKWILIIMLVFVAITQATHIDVRRSMASVPFFFLSYMIYYKKNSHEWHNLNLALIAMGIVFMFASVALK